MNFGEVKADAQSVVVPILHNGVQVGSARLSIQTVHHGEGGVDPIGGQVTCETMWYSDDLEERNRLGFNPLRRIKKWGKAE